MPAAAAEVDALVRLARRAAGEEELHGGAEGGVVERVSEGRLQDLGEAMARGGHHAELLEATDEGIVVGGRFPQVWFGFGGRSWVGCGLKFVQGTLAVVKSGGGVVRETDRPFVTN